MVYQFKTWDAQIADVTTDAKYQNLKVRLVDPDKVVKSAYDVATGEQTVISDGVMGNYQARLVTVRWGVNRENSETTNSSTVNTIRIQFPRNQNFGTEGDPIYRVRKGIKLFVTESESNPDLLTRVFTCTSSLQGGAVASRTLEFSTDGDLVLGDD